MRRGKTRCFAFYYLSRAKRKGLIHHTRAYSENDQMPSTRALRPETSSSSRLDVLERRIKEMGLHPEDFEWYVALRKYGTHKHAGFGLGFERVVLLCTGCDNIRDVIPYPRWPGNADF